MVEQSVVVTILCCYHEIMPVINCSNCTREYYIKPSQLARGGRFCSIICRHESQKTGGWVKCYLCNKQVWRTPIDAKKSASGYFFCSKNCSMSWKNSILRSGANHYLWNGGTSTYRRLKESNSVKIVCEHCGLKDKRVLVVHHIDHSRQNNELDNLQWLCRNCHYLAHEGKTL